MLDNLEEKIINSFSSFSWDLEIRDWETVGLLFSFINRNISVIQVDLIGKKENKSITSFVLIEQVDPHFSLS